MTILISVVALLALIVASFISGMYVSEHYADRRERAVDYALKKQFARLQAHLDADDTCQPYVYDDPQKTLYDYGTRNQ